MHSFKEARIKKMMIHQVGNKGLGEGLTLSENHVRMLDESEESLLVQFFLKPFSADDYHSFYHHSDVAMNEAYTYSKDLFLTSVNFIDASKKLAQHLYENTVHPRIKGGEFYVVAFEGITLDEEPCEVVGIFKSESKSAFLEVDPHKDRFGIDLKNGIDLKKIDKGCLIFNVQEEDGYALLTHDQLSKGDEAQYWKDDFLGVKSSDSEYKMTENYMSMCKRFVMDRMPEEFEVDRTLQIELLNRSSGYFTQNQEIDSRDFTETVLEQPDVVDSFNAYKDDYQQRHSVEIDDRFAASKSAVNRNKKFFKSVLKLDKNFHLYVHGNRDLIEHGYDEERSMKYYKVFYHEERS
ncbi:MAG: nucleoid-associated protein [Salibacteraceae bacterium]